MRRSAALATLAALLLAAPALRAEPGDAVLQLLKDKGLVPAVGHQVRQVRDATAELVIKAMNHVGVRYKRGGDSADEGFDCSGFTRHVFEATTGLVLPRRADAQAAVPALMNVNKRDLRPGDLVFFNTMRRAFSHVGIYIGEGRFIHAPRTGGTVRIEDMRVAYWTKRFNGARRADGALAAPNLPDAPAAPSALPAPAATESAGGSDAPRGGTDSDPRA
jgi:hypothetical protein